MTKPNLVERLRAERIKFLEQQIPLMELETKNQNARPGVISSIALRLHEYKLEYRERMGYDYIMGESSR